MIFNIFILYCCSKFIVRYFHVVYYTFVLWFHRLIKWIGTLYYGAWRVGSRNLSRVSHYFEVSLRVYIMLLLSHIGFLFTLYVLLQRMKYSYVGTSYCLYSKILNISIVCMLSVIWPMINKIKSNKIIIPVYKINKPQILMDTPRYILC